MKERSATHRDSPVVIAGATSIHGWSILQALKGRSVTPVSNTHSKGSFFRDGYRVDTENTQGWVDVLSELNPSALIYCAGVCNVDQCRKFPEWARELNVHAIQRLLDELSPTVSLVYMSTDHVFSNHDTPRLETDEPEPLSLYGEIRAEAEQVVMKKRPDALIVRPGVAFGPSSDGCKGHWDSAQRRMRRGLTVTVIEGEQRSAIWAPDGARRIVEWMDKGLSGLHHLTAERASSRIEIIEAICEVNHLSPAYEVQHRDGLESPHLGRVELGSIHGHTPLPAFPDRVRNVHVQRAVCCE